ncbi:Cholecystokinin receptor [Merluccius polli]|uniref:Gastrin/cholecystokinin type B receptor n=1 Tax=Merluccius polli TaxID=89951 RepID=A0AA47MGF4_MERPO|nr:Cholecystokinin receptor [Merluccius polli]
MGRNQRVQLDVVVGWMILPVGSVEILQAEQMFLQSSLLVLLAAHLDVLPAPWIPAGLYGVLPPDVGPVFGPSRRTDGLRARVCLHVRLVLLRQNPQRAGVARMEPDFRGESFRSRSPSFARVNVKRRERHRIQSYFGTHTHTRARHSVGAKRARLAHSGMASRAGNDSLWQWTACLERRNVSALNGTSATCGNETALTRPPPARHKEMDSFRILLYALIFLLSAVGNLLIIVVLALNKRMRTVTNCFLLSLALSDLMMAVFCMPFTLIPNVLEDFIFGAAMCKIVAYFMGISVSISTFSLVAIAIERYSAICNPLKSRAWQTRSHAYHVIAATWALSLVVMLPYPVFSVLRSFPKTDGAVGHMCRLHWPSSEVEQAWYVLLLLTLFFIPGVIMITAYGLISRELYRGIQFELNNNPETAALKNGGAGNHDDNDGCYIQVSKKPAAGVELPTLSAAAAAPPPAPRQRARANASESKWRAKKRVIRMLMVIVALFFVCWMPLYSANTWKAFDLGSAHRALSGAPISFIHLLSYTSACVNPIIYCFMNTRFRGALLATCSCCCPAYARAAGRSSMRRRFRAAAGDDGYTTTTTAGVGIGTTLSKVSYTAVSTSAGP